MKTSPHDLEDRPALACALLAILDGGMRLRMAEAADGSPCVRCLPAEAISDNVRRGLREHGALVRHVLTRWGDGYGFVLLCALWAGDVPQEPFTLRTGTRVTDGTLFIRELRRVAIAGRWHACARTGAFTNDVTDLITRPGFLYGPARESEAA